MQATPAIVENTMWYNKVAATTLAGDDPQVWVGLTAVVEVKMDAESRATTAVIGAVDIHFALCRRCV